MELSVPCFMAVGEIDIGSEAIDRPSAYGVTVGGQVTLINANNPANASGKITSVEIYASLTGDLQTCEVATFYRPDPDNFPNKFTTRDTHNIGNVVGGVKHTEVVDLTVEEGDYLGITFTVGSIAYSPVGSGYSGVWGKTGDNIPCANLDFGNILSGGTISLSSGNAAGAKFAEADCILLVNEHDSDYFGIMIDCELDVIRDRVDACLATSKGIRLVVTIDGVDVSDALTGVVTIRHNLNTISSFALTLADAQYSPLVNAHIDTDVEVVITAFVEGEEFKIFTGLVDTPKTNRTKNFQLRISGRGYGKKLLNKRATLISIQDSAENKYRGSLVKYVASQADIANINCPEGDLTTIDHSFQDQKTWDIVQKECEIEGWFVRFDEEAVMQVGPKIIKTDEDEYPNPDWEYGEGEFVELGFNKTDKGIINKVIVLGAIFEEEVITVHEHEVPPYEPTYDEQTTTFNKSWSSGEVVDGWSDEDANFRVTAKYIGWTRQEGFPFNPYQDYQFTIVQLNNDLTHTATKWAVTSNAHIYYEKRNSCRIHRETFSIGGMNFQEGAFSITITIKTKEQTDGGIEQYEEENPTETFESTITYTQIKASVSDVNSIALYGERKPREEYTLNKPLAETEEQCKRVGNNKILDSHRYTKQPDVLVNFNPLLIIGQTLALTDTKIGYDGERWIAEEIVHSFPINSKTGAIKARTRVGCVFYA